MISTFTFKMASLIWFLSICLSAAATSYSLEKGQELAEQLVREVDTLESYVQTRIIRIQSLEAQVKAQAEEIRLLKWNGKADVVNSNPRPRMRVTRATDPNVAFSFYMDHRVDHVAINNIITFNKPLINDGVGYNNITGVFTAPVAGVYLFSYMVNTMSSVGQLVVKLVVDGVNVSDGISDPMHPGQELQGGNTVVVRVSQGRAVWLAAYNTGNTIVDGRPDYRFSTFSGALLYT